MALTMLLITGIAHSEPIYLKCTQDGDDKNSNFSVKLDEANGKITHTFDDGFAFNAEGFFSQNEITYQRIAGDSDVSLTEQYKINRIDLSYIRTSAIESILGTKPGSSSKGSCVIVEIKDRKI